MKKQTLAALIGLVLLAGCTSLAPEGTAPATPAATNSGLPKTTVTVKLVA